MKENFDKAFDLLCQLEGFKANDPDDPGGLTVWGISSRYFPEVVEKMKDAKPEKAKEIAKDFYYHHFWQPLNCNNLSYPLDIVAFVQGVNAPGPAKAYLDYTHDWREFLLCFCSYYLRLATNSQRLRKYYQGWMRRIVRLWETFKNHHRR